MPGCMVHSHRKGKCSCKDIMNQLVWNNKYILNDGKSLYYAFFNNTCRIRKIGDLVSRDNIFLGSGKNLSSTFPLIMIGQRHTEWMAFHHQGKSVYVELFPLPPPSPPPVSFHWKLFSSTNKGQDVWSFKHLQNTLQSSVPVLLRLN